jgi:hypothetical protein
LRKLSRSIVLPSRSLRPRLSYDVFNL